MVGIDLETVNNWLRRGIINRVSVGGRQLRNRLFSTDEVYKAALTNELVQLGIAPSPSSDAVNDIWKQWRWAKLQDAEKVYAVMFAKNGKHLVMLCWQTQLGGSLRRISKSSGAESAEFELPRRAFAMIPIFDALADVTKRLGRLLGDNETYKV